MYKPKTIRLEDPVLIEAFLKNGIGAETLPLTYFILGSSKEEKALYCVKKGSLKQLPFSIKKGEYAIPKVDFGLTFRNIEQLILVYSILDPEVDVILAHGSIGSGKTLMTIGAGMYGINQGMFKKIFYIRPNVPETRGIGYLPGTEREKLAPWLKPFEDNLSFYTNKSMDDLERDEMFEVACMAFIKGRTLMNSLVILDEAQDVKPEVAKNVLGRIGEGSKLVLVGDSEQIAEVGLSKDYNTFTVFNSSLRDESSVAIHNLSTTVRSHAAMLARKIVIK